jgi:PEP-CTERM motif
MNTPPSHSSLRRSYHSILKVLASALLCKMAFFFPANTVFGAAVYNFEMPVTAAWYDTGIDVSAGSRLQVTASGIVTYWAYLPATGNANGGNWDGQQYFSTAVYPNTTVVSLIGKVGGTTAVGTGTPLPEGTPGNGLGFVGTSYDKTVANSGRLFLGFNDQTDAFYDNSGTFSVTVSLTPVPEPSTFALLGIGSILMAVRRSGWRRIRG